TASGALLPLPDHLRVAEGTALVLGIRPEDVTCGGTLQARVQAVEPMGAETQIYAAIGDDKISLLTRDRLAARPGEPISLGYAVARAHVFDAASEARLPG